MSLSTALQPRQIHDLISEAFPQATTAFEDGHIPSTIVSTENLVEVCRFLRDNPTLGFDYPASVTAIDYIDYFEVVYQLRSIALFQDVNLKVRVDRDDATIPSVVSIWPGVDFQEREIFDLMGLQFPGHPNLKRILLWDEFEGHPLRKDYGIPAPLPPEVQAGERIDSAYRP